eukprot:SAG31_NODE_5783_length_2328_cov_3.748543_3_plen_164_part_00
MQMTPGEGCYFLSFFCATVREIRDFNREICGTNRESVCINSAVAAREAAGPPVIQVLDGVRTGEKATQWKLGGCKGCGQEIRGGKVIEVGGGKWHADCFCCGRGGGEGFVAKHPGCGTAIGGEIKFKKEGKQVINECVHSLRPSLHPPTVSSSEHVYMIVPVL